MNTFRPFHVWQQVQARPDSGDPAPRVFARFGNREQSRQQFAPRFALPAAAPARPVLPACCA